MIFFLGPWSSERLSQTAGLWQNLICRLTGSNKDKPNLTSTYAKTPDQDNANSYYAIQNNVQLGQLLLFLMTYFNYSSTLCLTFTSVFLTSCKLYRNRSIHHQNFYHQLTDQKLITELDHYFPKYYVDWKCKLLICRPGQINEHNHCLAGSSNQVKH